MQQYAPSRLLEEKGTERLASKDGQLITLKLHGSLVVLATNYWTVSAIE